MAKSRNANLITIMKKTYLFYPVIVTVSLLFLTTDCKKEEPAKLAVLTTTPVTNFTTITASSGGNITYDGGVEILSNGVCWSVNANPTITDSKTVDAIGIAQFVSIVSGLTAGTTYHIRAYATNSAGTAYGEDATFTTLSSNTVTDAEGNIYNIITIGVQVWMAENLKTTTYHNGDLIGTSTPATLDISGESTPKYQWPVNGIESNVVVYGRLYTWYVVTDNRNICPTGWHVPSDTEWTTLSTFLGGEDVAGGKLKETGSTHWIGPNPGATNETGFTALPSGYRTWGEFSGNFGYTGYWWTSLENGDSSNGSGRWVNTENSSLHSDPLWKKEGFPVRCLRN
jgi:uncharacterized protein (TIGR02145 family)